MKKILFFAAICVSTMFAACGNKACCGNENGNDTVKVDSLDSISDSLAVDSTVCPD